MILLVRALALLALLLGLAGALHPAAALDAPAGGDVETWQRILDQVEVTIAQPGLTKSALAEARRQVAAVSAAAAQARVDAEAEGRPLHDQLAALGPPPEKGQPPEAPEVARLRSKLTQDIGAVETRIKQAELAIARANSLQIGIARVGREMLAERLFTRGPSPLSLYSLGAAAVQAAQVVLLLANAPLEWWRSTGPGNVNPVDIAWLGLAAIFTVIAAWPLRRWLLPRYGRARALEQPSYARRVLAAIAEGVARGLLPAAGLVVLAALLVGGEIATGRLAQMASGLLAGIIIFLLTSSLAHAALAPTAPAWRLVPFGAEASRALSRRLTALSGVAAVAAALGIALNGIDPRPQELIDLLRLLLDSAGAILCLTLLDRRLWQKDSMAPLAEQDGSPHAAIVYSERPASGSWHWPLLRLLVAAALIAAPVLAVAGYGNLAFHIVSRTVLTGVLAGVVFLTRGLLRELVIALLAPGRASSAWLRHALALTDQGAKFLIFWLSGALDLLLALPALVLLLLLWGVPTDALGLWGGQMLTEIRIGNVRFSLTDLALAVLVFVVVLAATRLVQRALTEKILPQTRLDVGVRHSLSAVVGYVGFLVAAAFAVSTLGLNLSNLALIAGALSVGIGFGLQNIVGNFVSGLVLLIERPVKVGDWVVVGEHEGFVTRISVRATEIETFKRASVIVPNSALLSGAVVNWTHRDKFGRVDVPVSAAYGSDTERVREVLLACAKAHDQVLAWPEPYVLYKNFGENALEFELRGYIADVENIFQVASDLHFAVDREFRAAGIEMPFPQRELRLRNVEELARAIAGLRNGIVDGKGNGEKSADDQPRA